MTKSKQSSHDPSFTPYNTFSFTPTVPQKHDKKKSLSVQFQGVELLGPKINKII